MKEIQKILQAKQKQIPPFHQTSLRIHNFFSSEGQSKHNYERYEEGEGKGYEDIGKSLKDICKNHGSFLLFPLLLSKLWLLS